VSSVGPLPLGTRGLSIQFPSLIAISDSWTINIPNTSAATYLTNENAYLAAERARDQAIQTAQNQVDSASAALAQAQANFAQVTAQASSADVNAARAQIISAQGQVMAAQAILNNTRILAPIAGTITSVQGKVGEQATALQPMMVLQNVDRLHAEANVSEANVASLKVGQLVDYTFDALGPDYHVTGTVEVVNPASTVVSGVVNYKITAGIGDIQNTKPGMTANMTILVAKKNQVLAVPLRAVLDHDNKHFVRVIDDLKTKSFHEVEVTTGLQADNGSVEIPSGLTEGQMIVSFIQS
ncbi:MAG TPA: efflux RND transporter periplasmic adaptor subunit, partial [Patescibacteria group bacterium]|nr:efflux RND transporter periplasmic adaptor subunit [Patescibacteria group bacterium]